jgi:hypothetical protein
MPEQPIGPILDGLGVTATIEDGDLIESAVVLAKIVDADGTTTVGVYTSDGMDWLAQLGLVTAAHQIVTETPYAHPDEP